MGKTTIRSSKDLLWTNPNPTSAMSATTLVYGATKYRYFLVIFKTAHIYNGYLSVMGPYIPGDYITLFAPTGSTGAFSGTIYNAVRTIAMYSNGNLEAGDGITMGASGTSTNNNMCIPYKIYGIK